MSAIRGGSFMWRLYPRVGLGDTNAQMLSIGLASTSTALLVWYSARHSSVRPFRHLTNRLDGACQTVSTLDESTRRGASDRFGT